MKTYLLFYFSAFLILTSCSINDDNSPILHTEVMPIESVEIPEHFLLGQTHEISVTYMKPSSCYQFYDFIYEINGNTRTVAVVNSVYTNTTCVQGEELVTASFDFPVNGTETYVFKFYQGENDEGVDQYYLVEVPVIEGRINYNDSQAK
jgi:hypothetical protein